MTDASSMVVVLDASALLAMIFDEAGSDTVAVACRDAIVSAVNFDEILHKVARRGIDPEAVEQQLRRLGIAVVPFDADQARLSAKLHARVFGTDTSFADRACLSLAIATGRPALTADGKWMQLDLGIDIRLIR